MELVYIFFICSFFIVGGKALQHHFDNMNRIECKMDKIIDLLEEK